MTDQYRSEPPQRYRVEIGHAAVQVEGSTLDEVIEEARRRFCRDMPRLWDLIQNIERRRFRVQSLPVWRDR